MRAPAPAACLGVALAAAMAATAMAETPTQKASLNRVVWIAGCWEARSATRVVEEQWMVARGGTLLGMSRTVVADTLLEFETVLIRERGGKLTYEAHPSGQKPAVFTATGVNDTLAVFEDPKHDFPQKISYRRVGADSLVAVVEGALRGKPRSIEFRYRRVACSAP